MAFLGRRRHIEVSMVLMSTFNLLDVSDTFVDRVSCSG